MFKELEKEIINKKFDSLEQKISALGKRFNKELEKEDEDFVDNKLITVREFSKRSDFSEYIIKMDIKKGNLNSVTKGSKKYLWSSDISDYIK